MEERVDPVPELVPSKLWEGGTGLGFFAGHYMLGPEAEGGTYRRPVGQYAFRRPMVTRDQRIMKLYGTLPDTPMSAATATGEKAPKEPTYLTPRGVAIAEGFRDEERAMLWALRFESRDLHLHPPEAQDMGGKSGKISWPRYPEGGTRGPYLWEAEQGSQFAYFAVKYGVDPWGRVRVRDRIYMEFAAVRTLAIAEGFKDEERAMLWVLGFESRDLHLHPPEAQDMGGKSGKVSWPRYPERGTRGPYLWEAEQGPQFAYFAVKYGVDPWGRVRVRDRIYMEFAAVRTLAIADNAVVMGFDNVEDARWFIELSIGSAGAVMRGEEGAQIPPLHRPGSWRFKPVPEGVNFDSDDENEEQGPSGQTSEGAAKTGGHPARTRGERHGEPRGRRWAGRESVRSGPRRRGRRTRRGVRGGGE